MPHELHATLPLLVPADRREAAVSVLTALAVARFAKEASVLAFGAPFGVTRAELDAWVAAGILHRGLVRPDPLVAEDVPYLAVTTKGARALSDAVATAHSFHGITAARMNRSTQKRAHDVEVGELLLTVQALRRDGGINLLALQGDDGKIATSAVVTTGKNPSRVPLQPDAIVSTRGVHGPVVLLVEVDRGTTAPKRMAAKYAGYLAWHRSGGPMRDFHTKALRVLTVVPDAKREARLHDAALAANEGKRSGFLLFAETTNVTVTEPERLMGPVARPLGNGAHNRLPLFDNSPAVARAA